MFTKQISGKTVSEFTTKSAVRTCGFSFSGNLVAFSTDKAMGHACELSIYDVRDEHQIKNEEPMMQLPVPRSKITSSMWGPLDEYFVTGHENGDVILWDMKSGDMIEKSEAHQKQINDIQSSKDGYMLLVASKDATAKVGAFCSTLGTL